MPKKTKTTHEKSIKVEAKTEKQGRKKIAELCLTPGVMAASNLYDLHPAKEKTGFSEYFEALTHYTQKITDGDLTAVEEMLAVQMHVLHAVFSRAVDRMARAEYLENYQIYGTMAMKAQNLSRMTAATLAGMKNPVRATFIKNTAHNQQINLGQNFSEKTSNELLSTGAHPAPALEENTHEAMDTRGTATPGRVNQEMETVGKSRC